MSSSTFTSLYSPLRNHQKPSGLLRMLPTTSPSENDSLPSMTTRLMVTRRPSSTSKTTRRFPSAWGSSRSSICVR